MRDQESEPHSVELNATTPGTNCGVVVDDDLGAKVGTEWGGGGGEFRKEVYTGSDKGGGGSIAGPIHLIQNLLAFKGVQV